MARFSLEGGHRRPSPPHAQHLYQAKEMQQPPAMMSHTTHHQHASGRNDDIDAATNNADERTHASTIALIEKAEQTIRTYAYASRPKVKRRRNNRRQRRPPKTSSFEIERRRRAKRSAGYEADIEPELLIEQITIAANSSDDKPSVGIFPIALRHLREKKLYKSNQVELEHNTCLLVDNHDESSAHARLGQRGTGSMSAATMCSPYSFQTTADSLSIDMSTVTTNTNPASTIPTHRQPQEQVQVPFQVTTTGGNSPFTLSQTPLTMDQAIALSHYAHIIVDARSPFVVKHANAAFCRLLGATGEQVGSAATAAVLGEPLLTNSPGHKEGAEGSQSRLQKIILSAGKIVLFPVVSAAYDGAAGGGGTSRHIVTHFLIQIVAEPSLDKNLQGRSAMRVVA